MNPDYLKSAVERYQAQTRRRVTRGAELLDEKRPGWYRFPFNWSKFKIQDPDWCLLGQLWRGSQYADSAHNFYGDALQELGISGRATTLGFAREWSYDLSADEQNAAYLREWRRAVDTRLESPQDYPSAPVTEVTVEITDGETPAEDERLVIRLNETERALLMYLLESHEHTIEAEIEPLSERLKTLIQPEKMTTHALLVELRGAV